MALSAGKPDCIIRGNIRDGGATPMRTLLCTLFVFFSLLSSAMAAPNIIVILVDDMGFSDLGCYGSEIATPNLDSLASRGLRFTQFYNTGRCCPTRR